jgi:hypothetical protein
MTDLTALDQRVKQHARAGNPFVTLRTAELSALLRMARDARPDPVPWAEIGALNDELRTKGPHEWTEVTVDRAGLQRVVDFARACAGLAGAKDTNGDQA